MLAYPSGMGTMVIVAFQAIMWGGGSFWIWFFLCYALIGFPMIIADSVFGLSTRRANPLAWRKIAGDKKLFEYFGWIVPVGNWIWVPTMVVIYGIYTDYMLNAWQGAGFWTQSPGSFFWGEYLMTFRPIAFGLLVLFFVWLLSYKSLNIWARIVLYLKPLALVLVGLLIVWNILYNPLFWQGWAFTFNFRPPSLLVIMIAAQAALWVWWRTSTGAGPATVFASYLPRGGDITNSVSIGIVSDMLIIFGAGLCLPSMLVGVNMPPLYGGGTGLVFSGLPRMWNALGTSGLALATLWYFIFIPAGFPSTVVYNEQFAACLMDKLGWTRTKTLTLLAILGGLAVFFYGMPIYDPLNGESFGLTLIFTQWYWWSIYAGICILIELILLFKYFKPHRVVEIANETSSIKLPKAFSKIYYVAFILVAVMVAFLFVATSGLVPGVPAGSTGTMLADGTGYYGLTPMGIGIMLVQIAPVLLLPLVFVMTRK
jgi:NSS family neurotransmitter:Na+ symporter